MEYLLSFAKWFLSRFRFLLFIGTPLLGFLAWIGTSLSTINAALDDLVTKIGELQSAIVAGIPQISSMWGMARYFFPVDLALTIAGILAVMTVLAAGFRIIKSLIPTIS